MRALPLHAVLFAALVALGCPGPDDDVGPVDDDGADDDTADDDTAGDDDAGDDDTADDDGGDPIGVTVAGKPAVAITGHDAHAVWRRADGQLVWWFAWLPYRGSPSGP